MASSSTANALTDAQDSLRMTPLFQALPEETLQALAMKSHVMQSGKRKLLFVHEDPVEHFFLIRKGHVKLFRESEQGHEVVLDIVSAGNIFGEIAVFNEGLYSYSAETIDDSELIAFPAELLGTLVREDHAFCQTMLTYMAAKTLAKEKEIETRALQEAPQRIGCFLLNLCADDATGVVTLTLPYEKTVIADRLGMRAETFSRALLRLQKDIDLTIKGAHVTVSSVEALRQYICSSCAHHGLCQKSHAISKLAEDS
ncbi:MAG: Crp/Fnr family transcriptional regulator [Rhodospirillales bacterium]|nr:Crp/Fnr family transcriptional regulator [Rhodospirillales bacterium]